MKKCRDCHAEIPAKATKCQHCGSDQRNWFRRHWIITIILISILMGVFASNTGQNLPVSSSSTSPAVVEELEAIKINAKALYEAYQKNEIAADEQYKNKRLEVSGVVYSIGKDLLGSEYVALKTNDFIMGIQCMLEDSAVQKAAGLNKGQAVVVVGTGAGKMGNVLLRDCVIR